MIFYGQRNIYIKLDGYTLHQSGFTLAASIFLGGHNSAAKEYNISLAVTTNSQNNIFSWLFLLAAKENVCFLGCLSQQQRKRCLSLAVWPRRQENSVFPWPYWLAAKKLSVFLATVLSRQEMVKNTCIFHISLFNPNFKFIIGISLSYKLQIWLFFFLKFSKIITFHLRLPFCMLISVLGSSTYNLFSSIQIENIKIYFLHNN